MKEMGQKEKSARCLTEKKQRYEGNGPKGKICTLLNREKNKDMKEMGQKEKSARCLMRKKHF